MLVNNDNRIPLPPPEEGVVRLEVLDGAYYAEKETDVIKVYLRDGTHLFGVNPNMIEFEPKSMTVVVQTYIMATNQGYRNGYEACKTKVTEVLKLCL